MFGVKPNAAAQERLKTELVLFSWAGYPRWPAISSCTPAEVEIASIRMFGVKPQPRTTLQSPESWLPPPEDRVFHREVKCVRRGSGFKTGDTVLAHYAEKH